MKHSPEIAATPMDVTGVPTNPMVERLLAVITDPVDISQLEQLIDDYHTAAELASVHDGFRAQLRDAFHLLQAGIWVLTTKYPSAEPRRSRDEIDITPRGNLGSLPIIVTNSVNLGVRAVMAAGRCGATGVIMQEKDWQKYEDKLVAYHHRLSTAHPLYQECCVLTSDSTVSDYWRYIQRYEFDTAVMVDGTHNHFDRNARFIGVVGLREIAKAKGKSDTRLEDIMEPAERVLTAQAGIDAPGVVQLLDQKGGDFLPILDGEMVKGAVSKKSVAYSLRFPPHLNSKGGLAYLVSLRHDESALPRIRQWIERGLVGKGFRFDRAHLDRGTDPFRFIAAVRALIDELDPTLQLHAGNIVTGDAALRTADAGANAVWVGIGPSPVCITRDQTGYGVPQLTAIENVCDALDTHRFPEVVRVSDGGVQDTPGHTVAVLRSGADLSAGSTLVSRTRESSPVIEGFGTSNATLWVSGNASSQAQLNASPRAGETPVTIFRRVMGPRSEGATRNESFNPVLGTVRDVCEHIADGLTSGISFAGGDSIDELHKYGKSMRQTDAGRNEGSHRLTGKQVG